MGYRINEKVRNYVYNSWFCKITTSTVSTGQNPCSKPKNEDLLPKEVKSNIKSNESLKKIQNQLDSEFNKYLDSEFNKYLDSKTTKRLDFKLKNPEYRDIVVYALTSLGIEPTLGNYRRWCQVLDFRAICERDLRKKGVLK